MNDQSFPKRIADNVVMYSADPIIYVVKNFISEDECKAFIEAAEKPKRLHITSSQLMTCFESICCFKSVTFSVISKLAEQPEGPLNKLFSTPTCHIA